MPSFCPVAGHVAASHKQKSSHEPALEKEIAVKEEVMFREDSSANRLTGQSLVLRITAQGSWVFPCCTGWSI
jgi:hypothetical protein